MVNNLIEYLQDKKILILGFGAEGQSTYKFIRKHLKDKLLYIADKNENFNEKFEMLSEDTNLQIISGENYLANLNDYDIIMKSPGISFRNIVNPTFIRKVKSQLELLLEFFDVYTIGVTGTKGKSTTSSLIYQILKEQNVDTLLLGNIGIPVFDYLDVIKENMTLVLEMSSHQLQYMEKSPNIYILLNIYEEHLDHYKSLTDYIEAKLNIFKYQKETDHFIYNIDNKLLNNGLKKHNVNSNKYEISFENRPSNSLNKTYFKDGYVYKNNKKLYNSSNTRKLLGTHNLSNIMFALTVSEILKLNLEKTINTINNFEPLPHRMEFVGKFDDVLYYNDSIATIPESTISTIEALKNVNTLLIGGMDRGIDYEPFIQYLNDKKIENIICMPTTRTQYCKKNYK